MATQGSWYFSSCVSMMSVTSDGGVSSADGFTGKTKQEMVLGSPNEESQALSVRAFRGPPEARGLTLCLT